VRVTTAFNRILALPGASVATGVSYSDGRSATNMDARALPAPEVEPDFPIMFPVFSGGGGPLHRLDLRYWILAASA
jgi:hypothetical protein